MNPAALLATPFALLLFASPLALEAGLEFGPEKGSSVTKTFSESTSFTLEEFRQSVDGQEMENETPGLSGENSHTIVVRDTYDELGKARPAKLTRVFEELDGERRLEIDAGTTEAYEYSVESKLEGEKAVFALDEETSKYIVTDDAGEGREEYKGLEEDMDLRGLLPSGEVEKFGSWEIDPSALVRIFQSGGDMRLGPAEAPDGDFMLLSSTQVLAASLISIGSFTTLEGEVGATWEETKEDGDSSLAVIALELELSAEGDISDKLVRLIDDLGVDSGEDDLAVEISGSFEGSGELVWNLKKNRFESLTIDLSSTMEAVFYWEQDFGGQSAQIEIEAGLSGESQFEARAKAE